MPELIDLLIRRAQRERTGLPPSLLRPEAEFGQPLTAAAPGAQDPQSPATQPGGFDIDRMLKYLEPRQEPTGVRAAIGRALSGFAAGVRATPREAAYESGLGGVVGGLSGAGEQFEAERKRRDERDDPRREFIKAMLKEQAQQPFDISKEQRAQSGKMQLLGERKRMLLSGIQAKKTAENVPQNISDRAGNQARANLASFGMAEDSPGYNEMFLQEWDNIIKGYKRAGNYPFGAEDQSPAAGNDPLGIRAR